MAARALWTIGQQLVACSISENSLKIILVQCHLMPYSREHNAITFLYFLHIENFGIHTLFQKLKKYKKRVFNILVLWKIQLCFLELPRLSFSYYGVCNCYEYVSYELMYCTIIQIPIGIKWFWKDSCFCIGNMRNSWMLLGPKSFSFTIKLRCNNVNIYLYRARYGISLMLYIDAINMFK